MLLADTSVQVFISNNTNIARPIGPDDLVVKLSCHFLRAGDHDSSLILEVTQRPDDRPQNHKAKYEEARRRCGSGIAGRQPRENIEKKRGNQ
ncbi:MAG: hypothetical protein DME98_00280 [Verrucomicrobia bacterium]|nr:MAG: hypothetical protein DME98_00280 [Verrucomicrobiota bacterium]